MLKITDKTILADIKGETITIEELSFHLMRHYSVADLADSLAEYIIGDNVKKVEITPQQLEAFFKITGYRDFSNNIVEPRGRKPKQYEKEV